MLARVLTIGVAVLGLACAAQGSSLRATENQSPNTADMTRKLEVMEYMAAMSGPQGPFCTIENGFDFVALDIGNVPGPNAESCCEKCASQSGCLAFTWTNYNGGTCWLKAGRSEIVANPNSKSALVLRFQSPTCTLQQDVDFQGQDLARVDSPTPEPCCQLCRDHFGCRAFSWTNYLGGSCWLKSTGGQAVVSSGVQSAHVYPLWAGDFTCALDYDADYVGNDLASMPGNAPSDCCSLCTNYAGCRAYSWSTHNGGTCWLKTLKGNRVSAPGVVSSQVYANPPQLCEFQEDTDFEGNDIANVPSDDSALCCPICRDRADCHAVVWTNHNGGTCWLKSSVGPVISAPGAKAAFIG